MSDLSSYSIYNPKQIVNNLGLLQAKKCLLSVLFGANQESYLTTILEIDNSKGLITLDYGPNEELNQHLLKIGKARFESSYEGIKSSFVGTDIKKINYKGAPAFTLPIPKSLYWLQRREYFRVKPPLAKPSYCQLKQEDKAPVNLVLYDISLTGFAMLNTSKEISEWLMPRQIVENAKLILRGAGETNVAFEVCTKYVINPNKVQKMQKIGCKITNLTQQSSNIIQNYIQEVQREDIRRE